MFRIERGCSRTVILTKNYAIKIASLDFNYFPKLLNGLLANRTESIFWKAYKHEKLCPVIFTSWLYLVIIMPRAKVLSPSEYRKLVSYKKFKDVDGDWVIPVENKSDSFGFLGDRIVAIDYGA